jgi:hypothetical protein
MKKILITTAICLIGVASVMAQGRIVFANSSATPIRISNETDGSASVVLGTASTAQYGIGPASVEIRLLVGLTAESLTPVLVGTAADQQFVLNTSSTLALAQGTFAGGNPLPLPYEGPVFMQFTATSINGQYFGASSIIQVTPALSPNSPTAVFGVGPNLWSGLTMTIVPEPSSMALAGLGAAALVFFRRRK